MSVPKCDHCRVGLSERSGTASGRGPHGYYAVFECRISRCDTCKGRCRYVVKEFVGTRNG